MNSGILEDPGVQAKLDLVRRIAGSPQLADQHDPLIVEIHTRRGNGPRKDYGRVTIGPNRGNIEADIADSAVEVGLTGMILGLYSDVLVLSAAGLANGGTITETKSFPNHPGQ